MKYKPWLILSVVFVAFVFAVGCSDEEDSTPPDGDEPVVPASVKLFESGEDIGLAFEEGSEQYKILPFWAVREDSSTGYSLSGSGGGSDDETTAKLKRKTSFAAHKPAYMNDSRYRRILNRHAWDKKLRALERDIIENGRVSLEDYVGKTKRAKLSEECGELELGRGTECLSEFDLVFTDMSGEQTDITVEVKGKGEHCSVVVDVEDNVSQEDIDAIIDRFDNVIHARDHFLYGSSVYEINGQDLDLTDRDQDGLRMIVLTHQVNDSSAVGFFNPADFIAQGEDGATNTSDILWVVVPDSNNPLDSVFGTVAHEYFHMIMFAVKGLKYRVSETVFLNESLAHLAEESSGFGIDNIDVVAAYLDNVPDYSWAFSGDEVEARGMGFLFLRYLFEQQGAVQYDGNSGSVLTDMGGAAFLKKLIATEKIGFEALDSALNASWEDSFFPFLAAVTMDGLPIANDPKYSYVDLYDDPVTGQKIGICTNCVRTNSAGDSVPLSGPICHSYEDGFEGALMATGADCVVVDGNASFNIVAEGEDEGIQFGLVRVQ